MALICVYWHTVGKYLWAKNSRIKLGKNYCRHWHYFPWWLSKLSFFLQISHCAFSSRFFRIVWENNRRKFAPSSSGKSRKVLPLFWTFFKDHHWRLFFYLTARFRWRSLRNGLFVVVVLGKLFWIPRKRWTFTALLADQRVHKISALQCLTTKLVDFRGCPRN